MADSLGFLTAEVDGGDLGDFSEGAAADLALPEGEEEGERRTELGAEGFFICFASDDSWAAFSAFFASDGGDLSFIFLVGCVGSSGSALFFSFSSFRTVDLLTPSTGGDLGFPPSPATVPAPLLGGVFSSGVFVTAETRGAFIAVVTSGEGVGVCVEISEG